jgi:signal peptidase I
LKVRAAGVSMLPTLWPGDVLTVQHVEPEHVEPGEIVLYMRQGRFFIHRIVSQELSGNAGFLVTRGDCMASDDPPVECGELLGKVIEVRRPGSIFMPERKLALSRRLVAWALCHWNLLRRIGLRLAAQRCEANDRTGSSYVNAA